MTDPLIYNYGKNIKSPQHPDYALHDNGTFNNALRNIDALGAYVKIISSGQSGNYGSVPNASTVNGGKGGPMGNRYFVDTQSKCTDSKGDKQELFMFVNNIAGSEFYPLRGIGPGMMQNIKNLNPMQLFTAFTEPIYPPCSIVTLQTVDNYGNKKWESRHIRDTEVEKIEPCAFKNYKNPKTNVQRNSTICSTDNFTTILQNDKNMNYPKVHDSMITDNSPHRSLPDDPLTNIYILSISCLGIYLMSRLLSKGKGKK